ncbi:MAG: DPP IV N-terminal domain-containing protein [Anaerolineales bacterium]|nr:DPP IV N-terminal domain-containing protein [Anaerolineales bacterium]MBX3037232.1 DPP IV N-terminal domain-containing protein [Anaerolineales bacterium]
MNKLIIVFSILVISCSSYIKPNNTSEPIATPIQNLPASTAVEKQLLIKRGRDYFISNLDGSIITKLYSGQEQPLESAGLSPDYTQFAYFKDNFVYIQNIETNQTVSLNSDVIGGLGGYMEWSPNEQKIIFTCSKEELGFSVCLINTENGNIEKIISTNNADEFCLNKYIYFLDWSDDGSTIVYSCFEVLEQGQKQPVSVFFYSVAQKNSIKILDNSDQNPIWNLISGTISPDNNNLLLTGSDANSNLQIFIYNILSKQLTQLTNEDGYQFQSQAWFDNESFYLYKTSKQPPYTSTNYIMKLSGEILSTVNIDGIVIK